MYKMETFKSVEEIVNFFRQNSGKSLFKPNTKQYSSVTGFRYTIHPEDLPNVIQEVSNAYKYMLEYIKGNGQTNVLEGAWLERDYSGLVKNSTDDNYKQTFDNIRLYGYVGKNNISSSTIILYKDSNNYKNRWSLTCSGSIYTWLKKIK